MTKSIGVIGGGAWGTALAQALCAGGKQVQFWAREQEVVDSVNNKNENTAFLPGVKLDPKLTATSDLKAISKNEILLIVTPAQFVRSTLESLKSTLNPQTPIVICSKGIELDTGLLLSQVAEQVVPGQPIAVLTGPSFASEIARGLPSAVTLAAENADLRQDLQENLGVKHFRPYVVDDMVGTQLASAIKNVIAIACGIVMGRKLGESARAALLTRGVAEIARLTVAMGGKRDTLLGMCGIGDLMLTCSSMQSRNYSLGVALGEGKTMEEVLKTRNSITEGIYTAKATLSLAKKNAVDMPITEAVNKTLNEGLSIDEAIEEMLNRPFKYEMSKK